MLISIKIYRWDEDFLCPNDSHVSASLDLVVGDTYILFLSQNSPITASGAATVRDFRENRWLFRPSEKACYITFTVRYGRAGQ